MTDDDFSFHATREKPVRIKSDEDIQTFNGSWYRGESTNFIPSKKMLQSSSAFRRFIIKGYEPPAPFIDKSTVVTAFGSCFAQNISKWLLDNGYNVLGKKLNLNSHIIRFGEGLVNTFAIREQLEWAFENRSLEEGLWFGENKEIVLPDDDVRDATKTLLMKTETLIITVGLSEVWFDKVSGRAFWRTVPAENFDNERHGFRLTTVEENRENLEKIVELRDRYIPDCNIIFTLSPIPLMATFRDINCISANTVSKSILRIALDDLMGEKHDRVYYFPSYELVKEVYPDPFDDDNRHPKKPYIQEIMQLFARAYCEDT
ncbi:GSCFA domain-containing protein [Thalassospira povalilytica]|uniref:GSCFA domain-containing protein n=1 Tax=Thalassospira povalilytica TaxID=732237 RepID=A0ABX4R5P3_9PROT|nr:GSCFA domain-containing protein [Thalassospira povalilytica]PKR47894.1 hypothetical protein CU041_17665 [Thalassospira povalilytica]